MDKPGTLVKECTVILVRLQHEHPASTQPGRNAKVRGDTSNQEAGLQPGDMQNPGQHGGDRGLAMGAGYCHHITPGQHLLSQPLWAGTVGEPLIQQLLHRWIASRQHVAHNELIRRGGGCPAVRGIAITGLYALQLPGHGWIDIVVRAADPMPQLPGQQGQSTYEGAACAQQMYMHYDRCPGSTGTASRAMLDTPWQTSVQ